MTLRLPSHKKAASFSWSLAAFLLLLSACAGHDKRTADARAALDQGSPWAAIDALNKELDVESADRQPDALEDDDSLLLLDRAMVLQQVGRYDFSSADLQLSDKHIEVLDFSRGALDDLGKYMFSDDSGPYQAPAYEKIMINTANMINYLCQGNFSGARIEARRFATMQSFLRNQDPELVAPLALGNTIAGLSFEASGDIATALNHYRDAQQSAEQNQASEWQNAMHSWPQKGQKAECSSPEGCGTLIAIIGAGRVAAKVSKRIPIGLALTYASSFISPYNRNKAAYLAGQGLVTWINFPEMGKAREVTSPPVLYVDGQRSDAPEIANLNAISRRAWKSAQGALIASAITRLITRAAAGELTRRAVGGVAGALISLGGQAALTANDTPDTRSWSTLPAKFYVARITLPAGEHSVRFTSQGLSDAKKITVNKDSMLVVNFLALR
ncbi:MAG: hypothetical protein IPJ88_17860 [Myxococcales bacterium]|nr:MAG: hypothetical protein IPJ88_17860 [Myxococcales bacterium]